MKNSKALLIIESLLVAAAGGVLLALTVFSAPAIGQDIESAKAENAACSKATWPYIPAECLTRTNPDATAAMKMPASIAPESSNSIEIIRFN